RVGTPMGPAKVIDVHPLQDAVTVYLEEEGRRMFQREELIPLEELEALQKKASEPCNKHGDEPCDCGQKPGTRAQDQTGSEGSVEPTQAAKPEDEQQAENRPNRRNRRRRRKS